MRCLTLRPRGYCGCLVLFKYPPEFQKRCWLAVPPLFPLSAPVIRRLDIRSPQPTSLVSYFAFALPGSIIGQVCDGVLEAFCYSIDNSQLSCRLHTSIMTAVSSADEVHKSALFRHDFNSRSLLFAILQRASRAAGAQR